MTLLKNLAAPKKREPSGPLTGKILPLGDRTLKVEAVLGEGGFATIYRAVDAVTQETFALKHFMLSGDLEAERDVQTEVAVMRALTDCPYVLSLHGAALGTGSAYLLLDYCHGTLAGHLIERSNTGNRLSDAEVTAAFLPIARAVAAMHAMDPPMTHRDVKAENVLRRKDGSWVLCDFGSATSEQKVYSSPAEIAREEERIRKQTTPAYRAPELWDLYTREYIGMAVDVWSLGCLLYFIAFGKLPFDGDAKLQILNGKYAVPAGRPEGVVALISDMLVVDPKGRITAAQVASRAAGMMRPMSGRNAPSGGGGRGAASEQQPLPVHRPPISASAIPKTVSRSSNNDACTSNDAWGQVLDGGAASTSQASHKETAGSSAMASLGGAKSGDGSGNWADFSLQNDTVPSSAAVQPTIGVMPSLPEQQGQQQQQRQQHQPSPPPPTQQLQNLQLQESSQIQEHCQVLEQLLDERNKEVSTLRNELKRANAAKTEVESILQREREKYTAVERTLKQEIEELRRRASQADAEIETLRQEALQQAKNNNKLTKANSINGSITSGGGGGGGSARGLSSFPLVTDGDDVNNTQQVVGGLGGTPMRQNSATSNASTNLSSGRASPEKRMSGLITGRQDSFFKDLNPLS